MDLKIPAFTSDKLLTFSACPIECSSGKREIRIWIRGLF